ncbi:hypothetical protein Mapa_008066 [Marchantia paleacea]|nr:hypothetical protein Mapa_008066 [Marchantia paleacea]
MEGPGEDCLVPSQVEDICLGFPFVSVRFPVKVVTAAFGEVQAHGKCSNSSEGEGYPCLRKEEAN